MSEGFLGDPWMGMLFFRFCSRYKIIKQEDRIAVLRELARRKKAKYLRDVDVFIKDKNVLKIIPHNDGPEHFCPECRQKNN